VRVIAKRDRRQLRHASNSFFPEFAMVAWGVAPRRAAGEMDLPTASEAFVSDYMGRDLTVSAELALDADGRFLALRTSKISAMSALTAARMCRWSRA
jgi:carbon-monoxide dehydrogenase large subunit